MFAFLFNSNTSFNGFFSSAGGSDDAAISAIQKGLIDAVKRGNVEKVSCYVH